MAIHQYKRIVLGFFLLTFSVGCHTVTQDELNGTGLSPDPLFEDSRTLVILPVQIPEGKDRVKFIWTGSVIDTILFHYLQFAESIPGDLENTKVTNASDIWNFYGADDPSVKKQTELLQKTMENNKESWLKVTPEKKEDIIKRYTNPARLSLDIQRGKETPLFYVDKKMIIVQSTLSKDMKFHLQVYDSFSSKYLVDVSLSLPYKKEGFESSKTEGYILELMKPLLKKALETMTKQKMFLVSFPTLSKDMEVYVEGKLLLESDFYIAKGEHRVYVNQMGTILTQGLINISQDGKLDISEALKKQKGTPLKISTNPAHAPLFLDEKYIGLSPATLTLPAGEYHLRTTFPGHAHLNYILSMDANKPIKDLNLDLPLVDASYDKRVKMLRSVKVGTFFSGILSFGGLLFAYERASFYREKINQGVDVRLSKRRYNAFVGTAIGFGVVGASLIITSAIFQLLEYQARDVGIGISEDGNLGVTYRF